MKIDAEQAIRSIIAYKESQRKQSQHEDKLMFDLIKNRKELGKKQEERMIKASGLKKKDLDGIRKEARKNFERSLEAFKKIKRPGKEPAQQHLSRYATAFNKPGHDLQHPGFEPGPQSPDGGDNIPHAVCFSSAIRCEGKSCERENAAIFPSFESDGVGGYFGNIATVTTPALSNSLYYLFVPLENGTATILAEVLLAGVISAHTDAIIALNFFFPFIGARSTADVKLSLRMNVWQGNTIINTTELPIVDVHCRDGESHFQVFRNDLYVLSTSTIVTQEEWIVIEIMAVADLEGRSHSGLALVDFSKGLKSIGAEKLDFGIRVPQLCVFVNPI